MKHFVCREYMAKQCLIPSGYVPFDVDRDGACLFRAIVQADACVNGVPLSWADENRRARALRNAVVTIIKNNKPIYNSLWHFMIPTMHNRTIKEMTHAEYVRYMSDPKTWGSQLEASIASKIFNRNICIQYDGGRNGSVIVEPFDGSTVSRSRNWLYLDLTGRHYTPYVRTRSNRNANRKKQIETNREMALALAFGSLSVKNNRSKTAGTRQGSTVNASSKKLGRTTSSASTAQTSRRKVRVRRRA